MAELLPDGKGRIINELGRARDQLNGWVGLNIRGRLAPLWVRHSS